MIRLVIIGEVTPGLNVMLRRHFQARVRDKRDWSARILHAARVAGHHMDSIKATGKRRVTIERHERGQGLDPDGLYGGAKDLLDSIVKHGLLIDDKPKFCELVMTQHALPKGSKKHLVITLQEIQE